MAGEASDSLDPDVPTHATKSAAGIDHEWQAAMAKYDAKRVAILRQVDRQADAGPCHADWETLKKFQIPQWYKDAKFGIFIHWGRPVSAQYVSGKGSSF